MAPAAPAGYRLRMRAIPRRTLALVGIWAAVLLVVGVLIAGRGAGTAREGSGSPGAGGTTRVATRGRLVAGPVPPGPPRMDRLDARHSGASAHRGPRDPELAWSFRTGGRITAQAVVDGRGRILVGSHDGRLVALGPEGDRLFVRDLGAPIHGAPYVDVAGWAYVGSDAGALVAFDRGGTVRWRLPTGAPVDTGIVPGPGRVLHFASGRHLYAVRSRSGEVRWRFRAREKIFTTPAVDAAGTVVVGSQDDRVYAVSAAGELLWSYRAGGDVDSSPVVTEEGGVLFGSDDGSIHHLAPDGVLRWRAPVGGYVRAPVALSPDGTVVASVYGPRARVLALDRNDGRVRWSASLGLVDSAEVGVRSGPLVDGAGRVFVGTPEGRLLALGGRGETRWHWPTDGAIHASPVLTPDGRLVFGSDDGRLRVLRPSSD